MREAFRLAEDVDQELEEERRQVETFRRIHRLYKHGFRPDWTIADVEDAIWWTHPGGYPEMILYPDGTLVASLGRAVLNADHCRNADRIFNRSDIDNAQFDRWLASVKKPTRWQAAAAARHRYIVMPLFVATVSGLTFLIIWSANRIWGTLF